eukprot:2258028-Amphidinium_carterae.6
MAPRGTPLMLYVHPLRQIRAPMSLWHSTTTCTAGGPSSATAGARLPPQLTAASASCTQSHTPRCRP